MGGWVGSEVAKLVLMMVVQESITAGGTSADGWVGPAAMMNIGPPSTRA